MAALSEYCNSLSGSIRERYLQKLNSIGNIDPYALGVRDLREDLCFLPEITTLDLFTYLISTHSFYTVQQMKAYKTLEAYKYYEAGFVQEVLAKQMNENNFVVVGKVQLSEEMGEKSLNVWIVVQDTGDITCAHCTCLASMEEVCSHVAAMLFFLLSFGRTSSTGVLLSGPPPPIPSDNVRIKDLPWVRSLKSPEEEDVTRNVKPLSEEEIVAMVGELIKVGSTPAIAMVLEPFASQIAEEQRSKNLPKF